MASGSWTFSTANKYITGRVRWTSTSNGNLYNSSKVTVYLDYKKSASSTENTNGGYKGNLYCKGTMDGTAQIYAISLSSSKFYLKCDGKWVNMASYTFTVKHNGSGACSCTLGIQNGHCTNGNSLSKEQTSTKTVSLDTIALTAPSVGASISSVTQTSFLVSWWVDTYYNKVEYNVNGGAYSLLYSNTTARSGSFTLSSRSPGTTYTIGIRITRTDATSKVGAKSVSATTIAIPTVTFSSLHFVLGSPASESIGVYVKGLDKGKVGVEFSYVSDNGTTIKPYSTTIEQESAATEGGMNFDFKSSDIVKTIYQNCTTKATIPLTLTIRITGTNNNVYTSTYTGSMTIPTDARPTLTGANLVNIDSKTASILPKTGNVYIPQGLGSIQVQIPENVKGISPSYATIKNYKIKILNSNNTLVAENTFAYVNTGTATYTLGTSNIADTYTVKIYAIDSRGMSSVSINKNFTVIPYSTPIVESNNLILTRNNNFEKELILHFEATYSNLSIGGIKYNPDITVSYIGQNITDSVSTIDNTQQISGTLLLSPTIHEEHSANVSYIYNDTYFYNENGNAVENIVAVDPSQTWKFIFTIQDGLSTITREAVVEQGMPILSVVDNGMVGINMVPDVKDESVKLQVNGDISSMKEDGTPVKFLELVEIVENLWKRIYPVGSIYMSVNNTNPSTFLGGTWVAWGQGRVPVGVGTSDRTFAANESGGYSTHTLTEAQMPAHTHTVSGTAVSNGAHYHRAGYQRQDNYGSGALDAMHWSNYSDGSVSTSTDGAHTHTVSGTAASKGSSQAHNNLQPYITCYMWKRTA